MMGCAAFVVGTEGFQTWNGLPDSPSSGYPYQAVMYLSGVYKLGCFSSPIVLSIDYVSGNYTGKIRATDNANGVLYVLTGGEWVYSGTPEYINSATSATAEIVYDILYSQVRQANQDIYYGESLFFGRTSENTAGTPMYQRVRRYRRKQDSYETAKYIKRKGESGFNRVNT